MFFPRSLSRLAVAGLLSLLILVPNATADEVAATKESTVQVEFLEIVTSDVDATCAALAALHGTTFGEPVAELGGAKVAELTNGGRISVRGPLHDQETPLWRPYFLTEDIEGAVKAAEAAGAMIAHPPLEIPGQGTFAIYILGGNHFGLWQN